MLQVLSGEKRRVDATKVVIAAGQQNAPLAAIRVADHQKSIFIEAEIYQTAFGLGPKTGAAENYQTASAVTYQHTPVRDLRTVKLAPPLIALAAESIERECKQCELPGEVPD
jgi:hypothetical protein